MALAGVTMAETITTEFDINRTGTTITFTEFDEAITLSYENWTYAGGGNKNVGAFVPTSQSNYVDTFSPSGQLRANEAGDIITMNFVITNNGADDITLDSLNIQGYCINGDGSNKTGNVTEMNFTMQLFADSLAVSEASEISLKTGNNISGGDLSLTTPLCINAGESAKLSLSVSNAKGFNTYIGLTGGSVTYSTVVVPEPTTATLSLLALAGLAARRRRK